MLSQEQTRAYLQNLPRLRQQLATAEQALQTLNPEERLLVQMLFLEPQPGNVERLCALLEREPSSIYRRRKQVLEKLSRILYPS